MLVELDELQRVVNVLFDHARHKRGLEMVEIADSLYWMVPRDVSRRMDTDPDTIQLVAGDLAEDWEIAQDLLKEPEMATVFQLALIAELIKAVGIVGSDLTVRRGG